MEPNFETLRRKMLYFFGGKISLEEFPPPQEVMVGNKKHLEEGNIR
jgi:hypothetical protein